MKDIFMILLLLVYFVGGYFLMGRIDLYFKKYGKIRYKEDEEKRDGN